MMMMMMMVMMIESHIARTRRGGATIITIQIDVTRALSELADSERFG